MFKGYLLKLLLTASSFLIEISSFTFTHDVQKTYSSLESAEHAVDDTVHSYIKSQFYSRPSLFLSDVKPCSLGSFKKYVTEKIAILTPPPPPPHVTACHAPDDTPLRYVTFLQDTPPPQSMRHIDQPLFDIV